METKNYFAQDSDGMSIAGATCSVYFPNTNTLVTGLKDIAGASLTNPFLSQTNGLIQFAAVNGEYDLRVQAGIKDYRIRVQCNDVSDTLVEVDALVTEAEGRASTAQTAATQAIDAKNSSEAAAVVSQNVETYVTQNLDNIQAQLDVITPGFANDLTSFFIPAKNFDSVQGTSTYGVVSNRMGAFTLLKVAGTNQLISCPVYLPSNWLTVKVDFIYVNTAANAGNVSLSAEFTFWGAGDTINIGPSVSSSVVSTVDPAPWLVKIATTDSAVAVNTSKGVTLRIGRSSSSVNDTMLGNIALIGVILRKIT